MNRSAEPVQTRRRRCGMLGAVFLFAFPVVFGFGPKTKPMPEVVEPDADRLVAAVLHKVIDGDSVELFIDGRIVRYELAGADAPDIVQTEGLDAESKVIWRSVEAKEFLFSLLDGEQLAVLADTRKPTDVRGNLRGFVYRMPDGLFVNLEMVRLGHAKHARAPSGFNNAAMLWAQDRARDARKGVWSPAPKPVAKPRPVVIDVEPVSVPVVEEPVVKDSPKSNSDSEMVYITKSGSKYHTKDCRHVSDTAVTRSRDDVSDTHKACKVCQPDSPSDD